MTDSLTTPIDFNSQGMVRLNRRQRRAPCELRVLEVIEKLAEVREKNPGEWWKTLGAEALKDYWVYLRLVLDYRFLDPWDHGEEVVPFVQECIDNEDPMMILAPRGAAKTGVVTVPLLPWLIAKDPTLCGIITNCREDFAAQFARTAAKIITESVNYRSCFRHVLPSDKWGEGGYFIRQAAGEFGGAMNRVDPSIGSYGVNGNIVGSHVRAMLHDDLINDKTYLSPVERGKAEAFLKESLNCLDPGGVFCCCATRWHFDDVYGKLEKGDILIDGKKVKIFKRGAERYVLDDDGQPVAEVFNPRRTFVDMHGAKHQVGYTQEELNGKKITLGALYSALYMNNPISDSDRMISVETINQFIAFNQPLGPLAKVGIEIVSTAESFWQAVITAMRDEKKMFSVERIRPKMSARGIEKHARIRAVVGPLAAESHLFIRDDLWARDGSIGQEIREFDRGGDDLLDALTYAILRAPKWQEGHPIRPYIAVDPAFTANEQSNYTAILVGCWWHDDFYVLDAHKFKAQKTEVRTSQIFKMADKYLTGTGDLAPNRIAESSAFRSPGNGRGTRILPQVKWNVSRGIDGIGGEDENRLTEERSNHQDQRSEGSYRRFRH